VRPRYSIRFETPGTTETWGGQPGRLFIPEPRDADDILAAVKEILAQHPGSRITIDPMIVAPKQALP
jgi:hypothetical protein